MSVLLGTIVLNEIEHLPNLYEQHKDWPDVERWVFVEGADRAYAAASPEMASAEGLSVDGTTEYLRQLAERDDRVVHVRHGWCGNEMSSQGKTELRQQYLDVAEGVRPEFVMVLDADEFYTHEHQRLVNQMVRKCIPPGWTCVRFRQRNIWHPPSLAGRCGLFEYEAVRAYWSVPHCRAWMWYAGMRYRKNHNWPQDANGNLLHRRMVKFEHSGHPQCVHLGFASTLRARHAKHRYYVQRGEGRRDKRQKYVDCRRAFEQWQPGDGLPHGGRVIPYKGPIPEVFHEAAAH